MGTSGLLPPVAPQSASQKNCPKNAIKMEIGLKDSYKFKSLSLVRHDATSCECLDADLMGEAKKNYGCNRSEVRSLMSSSCADKSGANYAPPGSK